MRSKNDPSLVLDADMEVQSGCVRMIQFQPNLVFAIREPITKQTDVATRLTADVATRLTATERRPFGEEAESRPDRDPFNRPANHFNLIDSEPQSAPPQPADLGNGLFDRLFDPGVFFSNG
jgi:hypothetical protein